jgi:hypothetical protein
MYIKKLGNSKFYCKKLDGVEILGTTPLSLQETIKAFKQISQRKGF